MSQPVYLLVIQHSFKEAWYQLSEEEQNSLVSKVQEVDKRAGAKYSGFFASRWSNEEEASFGIIEYPDIDKYQQKVQELEELGWWRYFSGKTMLGTEMPQQPLVNS